MAKNTRDYQKSTTDLVNEDGSEPDDNFRELRTPDGWATEKRKRAQADADYQASGVGAKDRSVGEHIKAGARALFEGGKFRDRASRDGERDTSNPLYDRKKGRVPEI